MIDFEFCSPTKIFFGRDKEKSVGDIVSSYGFKNVLIVFGSDRIKNNGLLDDVVSSLENKHISYSLFGGIRPNPILDDVIKARSLARSNNVDFILAIGGGSVIDTAKSIGASYFYEGNPFDFNKKVAKPEKTLQIGVILTFASAGSELSNSCVLTNEENNEKMGFNNECNRPLFVIENPVLTYSTPKYQTAVAGADIIMHSLERYFAPSPKDCLADEWALSLIKNVMINTIAAIKNPEDYDARANLLIASGLSHNGLTHIGKPFSFVVHPLEHALSGYRPDIAHGAGIALLYPAWAKYVYKNDIEKFARLGRFLFNINNETNEKTAIIGITKMKEFFSSIGLPTSFKDVGINENDIPALVSLASGNGTRAIGLFPQPLQEQDVFKIYSSLLG